MFILYEIDTLYCDLSPNNSVHCLIEMAKIYILVYVIKDLPLGWNFQGNLNINMNQWR